MAQVAALEALNKGFEDGFASVEYMVRQYNMRRKVIVNGFQRLAWIVLNLWALFMFFLN